METMCLYPGSIRNVAYADDLSSRYRLLEIDEELLHAIQAGQVYIKGSASSEAVLCSDKSSHAMKLVETTNSQLLSSGVQKGVLSQELEHSEQANSTNAQPGLSTQLKQAESAGRHETLLIQATANSHIELTSIAPNFDAVECLLQERPYMGDDTFEQGNCDSSNGESCGAFTFEELLQHCQASPEELRKALRELGAVEIEGIWKLVDPEYLGTLLEILILTCSQHDHKLEEIPLDFIIATLVSEGYNSRIVRHCLELHGSIDKGQVHLHEDLVCGYYADKLLSSRPRWLLEEFLVEWKDSVPEGMSVSEDLLCGKALYTSSGQDQFVRHFPAKSLPKEPVARFAQLFAAKNEWLLPELEPFLQGIQAPGHTNESLLLKFCRASQYTPDGDVIYSAR